ncbi:MAG: Ig-like domain-containing protein [Betaproteobacteria bacterium]|nr:Ig-like domain-containing protein [Betaproteobacteria bacterium]
MSSQLSQFVSLLSSGPRWRVAALTSLLLMLCACGGGGGGTDASTPPNDPNRVGAGWVTITGSDAGPSKLTNSPTVSLSGDAFISPKFFVCCTGSATDTGVTVSWANATTGGSGAATQAPQYCFFLGYYLCGHTWQATIDLVVGNNAITITATDPGGNLGRATVSVRRTPDVTPPTVSATSPANGATAVGTNSAFTVAFSEAMDPATISTSTILLNDNLNNPVNGSVTYSSAVATFTPAASFQGSTVYTATITSGVKDITGNALAMAYGWSFTTGPAPDTTPPTVSLTSPANGATCVPTETQLLATFSEAVSFPTVNSSTFLLKDSQNNPVGGTAVLPFMAPAVFAPDGPLSDSSSYTSTITTGITDLAGNHLITDYTWTFTTQAAGAGTWSAASAAGAPSPRSDHTAIWTGTQMIVWGGYSNGVFGNGARYDPATDMWTPMSNVGAPSPRYGHVAVWTGSKMIVWGGVQPGAFLNSGAIYDPITDTWAAMSSSGAPSARQSPSAVWTGSEMIVWGGSGTGVIAFGDGARYNPITNSWSTVSEIGAPAARLGHTAIWNGSAMIVWGGANSGVLLTNTGGIYTPSSDSWTAITDSGAPTPRIRHSAAWTGTEMIVWGGDDGGDPFNTGARFNSSSNTWLPMSSKCAPLGRSVPGIWSGTELIVWGGGRNPNGPYYRVGGRYNPSTDAWQSTPVVAMPSPRMGHTAIWTGTDMIVWGGNDPAGTRFNDGGRYRSQ